MKGIWVIAVLASVLFLSSFGLTQDVFAPPHAKPEKIKAGPVKWDSDSQAFVVGLSASYGIATAGENAGFVVSTTISFDANDISVELPHEQPIKKIDGAKKDSNNMIAIEPAVIPWDRNDGTFEGTIHLTIISEIKNSKDKGTGPGERTEVNLDIRPQRGIERNCDDGIDNDGNGLVDCDEPICRVISPSCRTSPPVDEICNNQLDDDGDGLIDLEDPDCLQEQP